jgi:hypothetical protein
MASNTIGLLLELKEKQPIRKLYQINISENHKTVRPDIHLGLENMLHKHSYFDGFFSPRVS